MLVRESPRDYASTGSLLSLQTGLLRMLLLIARQAGTGVIGINLVARHLLVIGDAGWSQLKGLALEPELGQLSALAKAARPPASNPASTTRMSLRYDMIVS